MTFFRVGKIPQSSLLYLHGERDSIWLDPPYQRQSGIWTADKRQLLIDSILNGFDIPKIYFHEFAPLKEVDGLRFRYAIVDGKQRLETIWGFIDNEFPLADDFELLETGDQTLAGITYNELATKSPKIKNKFDATSLDVVGIQTEELQLIEEMFTRLNEAATLTAAEKRNAFGGPLPKVIRNLAEHPFFKKHLGYPNWRYRHFDLAAKFLYIEHKNGIVDTKKNHLDEFVRSFKQKSPDDVATLSGAVRDVLDPMVDVFVKPDKLLGQVGMTTLYYHLFRTALNEGWEADVSRLQIQDFEKRRARNRDLAAQDDDDVDLELIEFEGYSQAPNDAGALRFRLGILCKHLGHPRDGAA